MTRTYSFILGAGCSNGTEKRLRFTLFTCVPSPRMKRPPDSSSRSHAVMAVIVGERGNARAIEVPTFIDDVSWTAAAAEMKAVFVVSAAQQDSKPASSTIFAIDPTVVIGPPIPIPKSKRPSRPLLSVCRTISQRRAASASNGLGGAVRCAPHAGEGIGRT
jgi:hypothetical protein